mmetsp:Transcript_19776/g.32795  ORF Transcript_19776/g.32795 Transcript_19776/m.32795 type:complete len:219 (-) Transcript_19776:1492-2148(-)
MVLLSRFFLAAAAVWCWRTAQGSILHGDDPLLEGFFPWKFERKVSKALDTLQQLLSETRNIHLAEHEDHTYNDKFALAEYITRSTWRSLVDTFSRLGLPDADYFSAGQTKTAGSTIDLEKERIFLHFDIARTCEFLEEKEVRVKESESVDTTVLGVTISTTDKYHYVLEYHWEVTEIYEMYFCIGVCGKTRLLAWSDHVRHYQDFPGARANRRFFPVC